MTNEQNAKVKVLPLGGLGEIGLNMMAIAVGEEAVLIDAGLMFPDDSMPGVDIVIPDIEALIRQEWKILGIVLTHGHEDHIGALPYILKRIPAPVFGTALTLGLVEQKLEEFGLLTKTSRHVVNGDRAVDLGPFRVDFFNMCHSVADSTGLAITTPEGVIIHSGDFKLDPDPIDGRRSDLDKIASYASDEVLALFSDSTNVERAGFTPSESSVRPGLEQIFEEAQGRILVSTFSSSTHRVQQILHIAEHFGRKVFLVGRSMASNARVASELGYLNIPENILMDVKYVGDMPDDEVVVLSTGSQGEPMSAMSLMALDRHKYLKVKTDDVVVFSSRFIPGNERAINGMINEFCRSGAKVLYEKIANVHVSGHAAEGELRSLLRLVRPKHFMPIHGEYRHLRRHAELAKEEGIPEQSVLIGQNGNIIEIGRNRMATVDELPAGRLFVDGKGVGDVGNNVLRDRRMLSEKGVVTAVIVIERDTGKLVSGPSICSRGVTFEEVEPELMESTQISVEERLAELDPQSPQDWENSKDEIRLAVRRRVNAILGRKPAVHTIIVET
jgi:ribonuclease J